MKKQVIAVVALLLAATSAYAQKATSGSIVVEGQVGSVFGNDFNISTGQQGNLIGGLRGRYFINETLAGRVTLGLGFASSPLTVGGNNGKVSSNNFGLALGIEKHFEGTKRLSPYVGGDILLSLRSNSWEVDDRAGLPGGAIVSQKNLNGASGTAFGVQGVIGGDYYFTDNVFVGVEFGLQLVFSSPRDASVTTANGTTTTFEAGKGSSDFNTNYVTGLRFGFILK